MGRDVPTAAVEAAFAQALDVDVHMDVAGFNEIVRSYTILDSALPNRAPAAAGDRAMRRLAGGSIDVAEVRRAHPIHEVVPHPGSSCSRAATASSGAARSTRTSPLPVRGRRPDRFHCFGCGASGDVIDYVRRRFDLGFVEAVASSSGEPKPLGELLRTTSTRTAPPSAASGPTRSMTWRGNCSPTQSAPGSPPRTCTTTAASTSGSRGPTVARSRTRRIGVDPSGEPTRPTRRQPGRAACRGPGPVHPSRHLIDTLRDRVVIPVRGRDGASPASSAATSLATRGHRSTETPPTRQCSTSRSSSTGPPWPRLIRRRRWSSSKDHWTPSPSPPPQPAPAWPTA